MNLKSEVNVHVSLDTSGVPAPHEYVEEVFEVGLPPGSMQC